ncbi:hypothetical protein [Desulfobacter sp.]|uniref:hypothetical protein n=1 Tax=Desulfobacter sp. TaxID=2294 RepID=UPI003D14E5A2
MTQFLGSESIAGFILMDHNYTFFGAQYRAWHLLVLFTEIIRVAETWVTSVTTTGVFSGR